MNSKNLFDIDNKELFRILSNTFSSTTLDYEILGHQKTHYGSMWWKIIKANVQCSRYNGEFKIQGGAIIEHGFFDQTNIFWVVKYFQVHVKSHEIHAAELDPVPESRKINAFIKVTKSTQLQDDYRVINNDARYHDLTAFYNKMNENLQYAY